MECQGEREKQTNITQPPIPCTSCNYCERVCPMNIGISDSLTGMNQLMIQGEEFAKKHMRQMLIAHGKKSARKCIMCGQCEPVCPKKIRIRKELLKVAKILK